VNQVIELKFKRVSNQAMLPRFAYPDDACFDLFSPNDAVIPVGESIIIDLGLASEIPPGYEVVLRPRSGMGIRHGIMIHLGTIDSGYRGNWLVRLCNLGNTAYRIQRGDRICQGALREVPRVRIVEIDELSPSSRGCGGLGSTGR